ncbi:MAG TPA: YMGG-like glycine zipper-containing protein [Gemmatimonadaceae bacterium]|nr:YMGG-like glycine zipper-containing protein [Gemmatimonadaceae bacterium]
MAPASVLLLAAAACGRGEDSKMNDALRNDLALASQAQAYPMQQYMSPAEQANGYAPYGAPNPYATPAGYPQRIQTVARAPSAPVRTTSRRSSSSGASRSSGVSYPAPAREPVRHTKRDAAIGAAAGAVLGASTSRDKLKGAIIGAAAGGVLGGIIGHTVDVQKP